MLTRSERHRLEAEYREPIDSRRVLAQCAAGLLVLVTVAVLGVFRVEDEQAVATPVSAPRVAYDR